MRFFPALPGVSLVVFSPAALACTVCDSRAAHQVRAGILNGHFLSTLVAVVLPFLALALAVRLVHLLMPDLHLEPKASGANPALQGTARILQGRALMDQGAALMNQGAAQ